LQSSELWLLHVLGWTGSIQNTPNEFADEVRSERLCHRLLSPPYAMTWVLLSLRGKIFCPEQNGLVGLKESVQDFLGSDVLNMGAIGLKGPFRIIQIPAERDYQRSKRNGTFNLFPIH
jgi:hypothetical protein